MGLWYLPIYTGPPTLNATASHGVKLAYTNASNGQNFFDGCVAANMSSVDSLLHHRCNSVSKHLPVLVDEVVFRHTLAQAMDIIAAFSPLNDGYRAALANATLATPTVAATAGRAVTVRATVGSAGAATKPSGVLASRAAASRTATLLAKSKSRLVSASSKPSRTSTPTSTSESKSDTEGTTDEAVEAAPDGTAAEGADASVAEVKDASEGDDSLPAADGSHGSEGAPGEPPAGNDASEVVAENRAVADADASAGSEQNTEGGDADNTTPVDDP